MTGHAEFIVYTQQASSWDIEEINVHRSEDVAIKECQDQHAKDGKFYEVEYLWVEGGTFGVGSSPGREIVESDFFYGIGTMPGRMNYEGPANDPDGRHQTEPTICTGTCSTDCRFTG